ncbi:hypothetical protein [Rhodococcus rhodochrous]|uniref:hypothetical protein n=1 Tax=Rhodococcus rhodochrous TaxID=1829 RepID=UPI0012FD5241|nr:hypothetical protein [Rhodococcus rhodochrous]
MIATKGYGVITTAALLVTAGSNPERLRSPNILRYPVRGILGQGDPSSSQSWRGPASELALHQTTLVRLSNDQRTQDYATHLQQSQFCAQAAKVGDRGMLADHEERDWS